MTTSGMEDSGMVATRHRHLVRHWTPWVYSGIIHLLFIGLLFDLALGVAPTPEPLETRVAIVTFAEGDTGDEGESPLPDPQPADAEATTEQTTTDEQVTETAPAQRSTAPMAPRSDPLLREPSPPTEEEIARLLGLGGSVVPMEGPKDAASAPDATSLFEALLASTPSRGVATPYSARTAHGRLAGIRANGGSPGTESAVEDGLAWLARHQDPNGSWRLDSFEQRCPLGDRCTGEGYKSYNIGGTALATLAFLSAGYHHLGEGDNPGDPGYYASVVHRATDYLRSIQRENRNGSFGSRGVNMYNHALATLTLAETYAVSRDPRLVRDIRKAVDYLVDSQESKGGWNYSAHAKVERNDVSITGWVLMALHSARHCGIKAPEKTFTRARRFLASMISTDGTVGYADTGQLAFRDSLGLVPVGLFSTMLLGGSGDDSRSRKQVALLRTNPPSWSQTTDIHTSLYYVYYGTLAMFFRGGDDWEAWNDGLVTSLLPSQRRTGHMKGSWDPIGKWAARHGGRVYSTAISVLCLEIYYKYQPGYMTRPRTFGFPDRTGDSRAEAKAGR